MNFFFFILILRNRKIKTGSISSEETKNKQSKAMKGKHVKENNPFYGKKQSSEVKDRISNANSGEKHPMYGKHHTEETKKKISQKNTGKHASEETKIKLSKAHKGIHSGSKNPNFGKYKLSIDAKLEIYNKWLKDNRSKISLSKEYKINVKTVYNIIKIYSQKL
jgi:hypothetical protein